MAERPAAAAGALEARLRALGADLAFPPAPVGPLRAAVVARIRAESIAEPRRRGVLQRPRLRIAAAVAALLAVAVAAVPPLRTAVAGFFGLPGESVQRVPVNPTAPPTVAGTPTPAGLGDPLGLGDRMSLAEAASRLPFAPLVPGSLGAPDAVYLRAVDGVEILTLVYAAGPGRPPGVPGSGGVALLVTEMDAQLDRPIIGKLLGPDATIEPATVGGDPGYWIAGHPHGILFTGPDGPGGDDFRLAGNALVWQHGPLLLRVEGAPTKQAALAVAASMR